MVTQGKKQSPCQKKAYHNREPYFLMINTMQFSHRFHKMITQLYEVLCIPIRLHHLKVEGTTICNDNSTSSCTTFNDADAMHIISMGYNLIRLGVAWPGAQPTDSDSLDPSFVNNLQSILSLCDKYGIYVLLDMHGDMVGDANCGWGVPVWFSVKAAPDLIGQPLETALPFSLLSPFTDEFKINSVCGDNVTRWAEFSGQPNYNILNECCIGLNAGGNNNALGFSALAQSTMQFLLTEGPGRDAFTRYKRQDVRVKGQNIRES